MKKGEMKETIWRCLVIVRDKEGYRTEGKKTTKDEAEQSMALGQNQLLLSI